MPKNQLEKAQMITANLIDVLLRSSPHLAIFSTTPDNGHVSFSVFHTPSEETLLVFNHEVFIHLNTELRCRHYRQTDDGKTQSIWTKK